MFKTWNENTKINLKTTYSWHKYVARNVFFCKRFQSLTWTGKMLKKILFTEYAILKKFLKIVKTHLKTKELGLHFLQKIGD